MTTELMLSRLDKVKRTGTGRWQARCPAHDDKGPSLSIRELDDGRVLLHCFAACGTSDVLEAVGLEFSDLFPEKPPTGESGHRSRPEARPFHAMDVLGCVAFEALIAATACTSMLAGHPFSAIDRARLILAAERLQAAVSIAGGQRG